MAIGYALFWAIALLPLANVGGRDITVRCPHCEYDQSIPPDRAHFQCGNCRRSALVVANFAPPEMFD